MIAQLGGDSGSFRFVGSLPEPPHFKEIQKMVQRVSERERDTETETERYQ